MLFVQFAMTGLQLLESRINTVLMDDMPNIIEQLFDKFLATTIQCSSMVSETKINSAEKFEELKKYAGLRVWQAMAATPAIDFNVPTEHKEKFEEIFKPLQKTATSDINISIEGMVIYTPFLGTSILLPEGTSLRIVYLEQYEFNNDIETENDSPSES